MCVSMCPAWRVTMLPFATKYSVPDLPGRRRRRRVFFGWRNTYRIITNRRPRHRPPPALESFSIVSLSKENFIEYVAEVAIGGVCVISRFLFLLICRRRCVIRGGGGGGGGGGLVSLV